MVSVSHFNSTTEACSDGRELTKKVFTPLITDLVVWSRIWKITGLNDGAFENKSTIVFQVGEISKKFQITPTHTNFYAKIKKVKIIKVLDFCLSLNHPFVI